MIDWITTTGEKEERRCTARVDRTRGMRGTEPKTVSLYIHWVPVTERLPDDELTVLLVDESGEWAPGYHADGQWVSELATPVKAWAAVQTPLAGGELRRELQGILATVCAECRVTVEEVQAPGRKRHVVWARFAAAHLMQRVLGAPDKEIAALLQRSRSDCSTMRSAFRNWLEVDRHTKDLTARLLRVIEGRIYGS